MASVNDLAVQVARIEEKIEFLVKDLEEFRDHFKDIEEVLAEFRQFTSRWKGGVTLLITSFTAIGFLLGSVDRIMGIFGG